MYMAPEVLLCQPYNEKADVFSFALIMYEVTPIAVRLFSADPVDPLVVVKQEYIVVFCLVHRRAGRDRTVRSPSGMRWKTCCARWMARRRQIPRASMLGSESTRSSFHDHHPHTSQRVTTVIISPFPSPVPTECGKCNGSSRRKDQQRVAALFNNRPID